MKATNLVKRTLALGLIFLMMAALMGTSAFADDPQPVTDKTTGTITVKGISDDDNGKVTVSFYRLTKLAIDENSATALPQASQYVWTDGVADFVDSNYPDYIYHKEKNKTDFIGEMEDNSVTEQFDKSNTALDVERFYDELAAYIAEKGIAPIEHTDANGTIDGLPMGNYMILITGGISVYRPAVVALIPGFSNGSWLTEDTVTAEVDVKASTPGLSKTIVGGKDGGKVTNGAMGDKVSFQITATIPTYPKISASKVFTITDTMTDGLTFSNDVKVKGNGTAELKEKTDTNPDGAYTVTQNGQDVVVDFVYDKIKEYGTVQVTYSAVINGKAAVGAGGSSNSAVLSYSNDPHVKDNSKDTQPSITKIYTYGIQMTKVDATDDSVQLADATFKLVSGSDPAGEAISFVAETAGEKGVYHKALPGEDGEGADVITGADGVLTLKGLGEGEYTLVELAPPPGYLKPEAGTLYETVKIVDAKDGLSESAGAYPNGKPEVTVVTTDDSGAAATETVETDGYVSCAIPNTPGSVLPLTGGMGTTAFIAAGALLATLSLFGLAVTAVKKRA